MDNENFLPDFVKDASLFEEMVKTAAWQRFVALADSQRDSWTLASGLQNQQRAHPEFTLGYLLAIKTLTSLPVSVIARKDAFVADEQQRHLESVNANRRSNMLSGVHPPPQAV